MRRLVFICATAVLVSGCAKDLFGDQVARLHKGMNTVEVSAVLGSPLESKRRENSEAWQYCWKGITEDGYFVAWLEDSLLSDWEMRRSVEFGDCPTLMETLVWPEDRGSKEMPAS